jgi:hypothetical protein
MDDDDGDDGDCSIA